jgi:hypothetical protein
MRRALTMLTYLPAALALFLLIAWIPSQWWTLNACLPLGSWARLELEVLAGRAELSYARIPGSKLEYSGYRRYASDPPVRALDIHISGPRNGPIYLLRFTFPIVFWLTLLLPLSVDPWSEFPVWAYLAYSVLIGAEMAYYLR